MFYLTDILIRFEKVAIETFHVSLLKCMTLPQFAWSAGLLALPGGFKLHIVKDLEMYNLCQRAIRGGLSQNRMPYVRANLPNTENYDPHRLISTLSMKMFVLFMAP